MLPSVAEAGCYRLGETGYHWYHSCWEPRLIYPHHRVCRRGYCWYRYAKSPSYERIDDYSQGRLREWRKEIRRDGPHLRTLRPKLLHRLRIRCKRFRYIVAALQTLKVPLARTELTFCEVARKVHGALGDLRDLKRLRKAGHGRPPGYRMRKRNLLREAGSPFRRGQAGRIHSKPAGDGLISLN
jgi:CHAD domain-containing protein